jgi:hypothetical protein
MTFTVDGVSYNEQDVPDRFRDLVAFMPIWAIADEETRCQLQEAAPDEVLETMVAAIEPRLNEIEDYVKSFGDSRPPIVELLNRLAESVVECSVELDLRPVCP